MRAIAFGCSGLIGPAGTAAITCALLTACQPSGKSGTPPAPEREAQTTPLPTRQTTIDPVNRKLEAAQQETERRRAEVDAAAK